MTDIEIEGSDDARSDRKGQLIVVSNRVALPEAKSSGGLAPAVHAALREEGGIWFGWSGRTSEDEAIRTDREGAIRFMTRDLDRAAHRDYYSRFSNRVLWPLLHGRLDLVAYRRDAFDGYLAVNATFADALAPLAGREDRIWVHDYHLIPLAQALRERGVASRIGFFLHVPVAPVQTLTSLPQHADLFARLAAFDLVGVQTEDDARRLRDYFRRVLHARPPEIRAFPIGIDTQAVESTAARGWRSPGIARLRKSLGGGTMMIGVDRLDYSKGLPERLRAFERLLERKPELHGEVTLLQIAPPTRAGVPEYRTLDNELQHLTGRINGRHSDPNWTPIRYLNRGFAQSTLFAYYRAARVGVVTPLRDGMNLVAKEYVAAQNGADPGVLVLSRFAGAAAELDGALLVNPIDTEECADALARAIEMPLAERRERWASMMDVLADRTVHAWRNDYLAALGRARPRAPSRRPASTEHARNAAPLTAAS